MRRPRTGRRPGAPPLRRGDDDFHPMNVILFQNRFEAPILAGVKTCTIRAHRRDGRPRAVEGEAVSLRVWTGAPYRSKQREFAQRTVKFTFPVRVGKTGIERLDLANGK